MRTTRLFAAILCVAMLLPLIPATTLAAEMFEVTVTAGENGTIIIGDEPQHQDEDTRVYFRSDTEDNTISIEANDGGADDTPVPIKVTPDEGYEIESVKLGETVLNVGDSIGVNPVLYSEQRRFCRRIPGSYLKIQTPAPTPSPPRL